MKACIVTVYNSTNCGSYLQAYALYKTLKAMGAGACFLKTGVKNNRKIFLKKAYHNIRDRRFSKIPFDYKVLRNFERALKRFDVIPREECDDVDAFIFGSDEIWNASREVMRNAPVFWGEGLTGKKYSYAPSVNTATADDIEKMGNVRQILAGFEKISVRDSYSERIISRFTEKKPEILPDPTFLLDAGDYDAIEGKCPVSGFVLIYSAGRRFSEKDIANIKGFAESKGLKTVSFPHELKWCDLRFPADPFDAVAFFKKASYVITDTFHGAALSLIFKKRFAAIPKENTKVRELLTQFGMEDRVREDSEGLKEFFDGHESDLDSLDQRIAEEREKGLSFIRNIVADNS